MGNLFRRPGKVPKRLQTSVSRHRHIPRRLRSRLPLLGLVVPSPKRVSRSARHLRRLGQRHPEPWQKLSPRAGVQDSSEGSRGAPASVSDAKHHISKRCACGTIALAPYFSADVATVTLLPTTAGLPTCLISSWSRTRMPWTTLLIHDSPYAIATMPLESMSAALVMLRLISRVVLHLQFLLCSKPVLGRRNSLAKRRSASSSGWTQTRRESAGILPIHQSHSLSTISQKSGLAPTHVMLERMRRSRRRMRTDS